jgi:sterol desaturase/sphingolipid hydroxylase (fatty acid hydroxylase superfamily)
METYGKILLIAMPAFLGLVLFEKWWGWRKGKDTVRLMDMIASLTSGITNVTKDVLGLSIVVLSYGWMVNHFAIVHIQSSWVVYLIAFMALDLTGYLVHRIDHTINFFWNAHLVHHSSEEYNLACALRQSISTFFRLFTIFLLPAALLGVPANVIAIVAPIHLFAQFWYHTQHINKMGWLEHIIVTPSHHRVHHALNPEYIDKNFGQIFIFWDKWFGTFQKELPHIQPVYGITRPVSTWNPFKINFMHISLLIKDAWRTEKITDKLKIWFMPTGWRPEDVSIAFPVSKINDPYNFKKYDTPTTKLLTLWVIIQFIFLIGFIIYFFGNIAPIGNPGIFYYGAFVFLFVYAYTELMDGNQHAWAWEVVKSIVGITLLFQFTHWFGAGNIWGGIPYVLMLYFIASPLIVKALLLSLKKQQAITI